jgi:hypothetical protein
MPSGPAAKPTIEDLRHVVYSEVITSLAPASYKQTNVFMANLRLPQESLAEFVWPLFAVSNDIAETSCLRIERPVDLLRRLDRIFGEDIDLIAGFYRDVRGNLCWTIPDGCGLYAYSSLSGRFNGILCQPLRSIDKFWLLSSAKFGGAKAIRLTNQDAAFFEAGLYKPTSYRIVPNLQPGRAMHV